MVICYLCEQSFEEDQTVRTVVPSRKHPDRKERICLECAKMVKGLRTDSQPFQEVQDQ